MGVLRHHRCENTHACTAMDAPGSGRHANMCFYVAVWWCWDIMWVHMIGVQIGSGNHIVVL